MPSYLRPVVAYPETLQAGSEEDENYSMSETQLNTAYTGNVKPEASNSTNTESETTTSKPASIDQKPLIEVPKPKPTGNKTQDPSPYTVTGTTDSGNDKPIENTLENPQIEITYPRPIVGSGKEAESLTLAQQNSGMYSGNIKPGTIQHNESKYKPNNQPSISKDATNEQDQPIKPEVPNTETNDSTPVTTAEQANQKGNILDSKCYKY